MPRMPPPPPPPLLFSLSAHGMYSFCLSRYLSFYNRIPPRATDNNIPVTARPPSIVPPRTARCVRTSVANGCGTRGDTPLTLPQGARGALYLRGPLAGFAYGGLTTRGCATAGDGVVLPGSSPLAPSAIPTGILGECSHRHTLALAWHTGLRVPPIAQCQKLCYKPSFRWYVVT